MCVCVCVCVCVCRDLQYLLSVQFQLLSERYYLIIDFWTVILTI